MVQMRLYQIFVQWMQLIIKNRNKKFGNNKLKMTKLCKQIGLKKLNQKYSH